MTKKQKAVKDAATRQREAENITIQLKDLGFTDMDMEGPQEALRDFVVGGIGSTQTFKYHHLGVHVLLQLSVQPHVTSFARVRRV